MKAITMILTASLLMINAVSLIAQDSTNYQSELERFQAMKRSGIGLLVAGVPMATAGISLFIYDRVETPSSSRTSLDNRLSAIVLVVGLTGVVFTIIGVHRVINGKQGVREYQSKLNNLKVGSYIIPNQAGITLSYRF